MKFFPHFTFCNWQNAQLLRVSLIITAANSQMHVKAAVRNVLLDHKLTLHVYYETYSLCAHWPIAWFTVAYCRDGRPSGTYLPYRAAFFTPANALPLFRVPIWCSTLARGYVPPQFGVAHLTRLTRYYQPTRCSTYHHATCISFQAVVWSELSVHINL